MNKRGKNKVDRAYREARLSAFLEDVGDIRVVLAFLALGVAIAGVLALLLSPPRFVAHATGHAVGQFVDQGEASPPTWIVSVRLDTRGTASVIMPKSQPYRPDVAMKIDVYEQGFGPIKWASYRFKGYADAPAR
jgi:hypothetical protein